MRSKEDSHDYRYFPDPDLLPLTFTDEFVDELKKHYQSFQILEKKDLLKTMTCHPTTQIF